MGQSSRQLHLTNWQPILLLGSVYFWIAGRPRIFHRPWSLWQTAIRIRLWWNFSAPALKKIVCGCVGPRPGGNARSENSSTGQCWGDHSTRRFSPATLPRSLVTTNQSLFEMADDLVSTRRRSFSILFQLINCVPCPLNSDRRAAPRADRWWVDQPKCLVI